MPITTIIPEILVFLTLLSDIFIGLMLVNLAIKLNIIEDLKNSLRKNSLLLAFVVSLAATLGSLFYSEILGYTPCKLCWFQRIFMYPLPIIFAIALKNKDLKIKKYTIALAIIGALIAAYHYLVQVFQFTTSCGTNSEIPCNLVFSFELGYITIPMMALTAFVLIIIFTYKKKS